MMLDGDLKDDVFEADEADGVVGSANVVCALVCVGVGMILRLPLEGRDVLS